MNIFIAENDKKDDVKKRYKNIFVSDRLIEELNIVFSKVYNNKIGYSLFKDNDQYYKIFVLPKHIKLAFATKQEEKETIIKFLKYLEIYYSLKRRHKSYKNSESKISSYLDISMETYDGRESAQEIEQFVFSKYRTFIAQIKTFFESHRGHNRVKHEFVSQTIKSKIDLYKNIKEPNKTKIHQSRMEDISYSQIASTVYGALKLFIQYKLPLLENYRGKDSLVSEVLFLKSLLEKKYNIEKGYRLTLHKLVGSKTNRIFRKKSEYLALYMNILSLFGLENFFEEEDERQLNRDIRNDSFFIEPDKLYEWYIFDILSGIEKDNNKRYIVKFDKHAEKVKKTKINYPVSTDSEEVRKRISKPDIVIEDTLEQKVYIIDAKWKNLEFKKKEEDQEFPENSENKYPLPGFNDVAKLKRDCEVHPGSNNIYAVLIYPYIQNLENDKVATIVEPTSDQHGVTFLYHIMQISFDATSNFKLDLIEGKALKKNHTEQLIEDMQGLSHKRVDNIIFAGIKSDIAYGIIVDQLTEDLSLLRNKYTFNDSLVYEYYKYIKEFLNTYYYNHDTKVLEPECIDFLESAAYTATYFDKYMNHTKETLDYTLPASAIWKTIEIELNATIIHLIRYSQKICSRESYCIRTDAQTTSLFIVTGYCSSVDLTDGGKILKSCTLGNLGYILREVKKPTYDIKKIAYDAFLEFVKKDNSSYEIKKLSKDLNAFVQKIKDSRNKYIHNKKMSFKDFEMLIIDTFQGKKKFDLANLMELKIKIKKYMA